MTDPAVVATTRIVVRRFRVDDAAALHAYRNDPDTARWQGWGLPYPLADAERLIDETRAGLRGRGTRSGRRPPAR